jgi:hypothetical protein
MNTITNIQTHLTGRSTCPQLLDVSVEEICEILAVIIRMGHDKWDRLKDYLPTLEKSYMSF